MRAVLIVNTFVIMFGQPCQQFPVLQSEPRTHFFQHHFLAFFPEGILVSAEEDEVSLVVEQNHLSLPEIRITRKQNGK